MRIVVKVGTSTLAHPGGRLNIRHTEDLVKVWSDIKNAGHELIVVSSAATGLGVGKLQIQKPQDITTKQAAAAVGQCELMYTYDRLFGQYNHTVAQMLLTWEDFDHENRLHNLRNTLERLLELGAIPIINENDTIATAEIKVEMVNHNNISNEMDLDGVVNLLEAKVTEALVTSAEGVHI